MPSIFQKLKSIRDRNRRVEEHIKSMRCCWCEWEGPRVEDSVHGRCSVNNCCVHSLTHNDTRYHYMAPCKIESISEDGMTIIAVIEYDADAPEHCQSDNGERLRLDITDVLAPTAILWAMHYAEELAEAKAAGTRCQCGGEIASKYSGIFRCQPCIDAENARREEALKPKRKSKKAKKPCNTPTVPTSKPPVAPSASQGPAKLTRSLPVRTIKKPSP